MRRHRAFLLLLAVYITGVLAQSLTLPVMEGSDDGPIVNKGAPKHSLLVRALHGDKVRRMPPGPNPLAEQKIALIEKWILTGAKEK